MSRSDQHATNRTGPGRWRTGARAALVGGATALAVTLGTVGTTTAATGATEAPEEASSTWTFDGNAHDVVSDRHGEALPGVVFADGSAQFSGADDAEVRIPHDRLLEPGDGRWSLDVSDVVPGPLTGKHQTLATSRSTTNQGWALYIMPNGELRFWSRVVAQGAWAQFPTGVVVTPGTRYDVSVDWEPGTVTVEVSGGASSVRTVDMAMPVVNGGSNPIRLGNGGDRGDEFFYRGSIGEVTLSATPRADDWGRCVANATSAPTVVPPAPGVLDREIPADELTQLSLTAARNANRYLSTTYWDGRFADEQGERINLAQRLGNTEDALRGPAMAAVNSAILLATGAYDPADTGVSEAEARERVVRLVSSAAAEHRANDPGGWGTESSLWQSSLWAYYNAFAAWLLWDDLDAEQQACVTTMVVMEAEAMPAPAYYRDADGTVVRPGDTKAEENAWQSSLSGLAALMMPGDERSAEWRGDALDLSIAAWATPEDVARTDVVNGRRLDRLLGGSNVESDGTVANHNLMHPIYMLAFDQSVNNALAQQMTGQLPAAAFLHNVDLTYGALVDLDFPSPPWLAPGGTIYVPGEPAIHYPDGNDWGTTFPLYFAQADVIADAYGIGDDLSAPASEWARLHLQAAVDLQERFADGHTYRDTTESNYRLREERTAQIAAHTFLTRVLNAGARPCLTDRPYSTATSDPLLGELESVGAILDGDTADELPEVLRATVLAGVDAVTAARESGDADAVSVAVRDLQLVLVGADPQSGTVTALRDVVGGIGSCVLGLPVGLTAPEHAVAGEEIVVGLTGGAAGAGYAVTLDDVDGPQVGTIRTGSDGAGSASVVIPADRTGRVAVVATSGGAVVSVEIEVSASEVPVDVVVEPRCLAGTAHLAVRATSLADRAISVRFVTDHGTRSFVDVAPGQSAYQAFSARSARLDAGTVTVETGLDGSERSTRVAYDALACG